MSLIIALTAQKRKAVRGFTLIEILVVIAIIAILAAITLSVFARAKESGKKAACISNLNQTVIALQLYLDESDGVYPQTRKSSSDPSIDDAAGALEEPDFGSTFDRLLVYSKSRAVFACPTDTDARGRSCDSVDPDHPELDSFIFNGYFAFGIRETSVAKPSETIVFSERRSAAAGPISPYCLYLYRPWFNSANSVAPEDDMDPDAGAIATGRHAAHSNYAFTDGHVNSLAFGQTYSTGVNLHKP